MVWRALAVMLVLLGVAWGGVSAQAPVATTIFVDEDTLTLFIPEQGIVSVYGLAIEVDTGTERITRTLDFYPSLRGLRLDSIPTPICYRLERDTSVRTLPLDCPASSTLIQRLASADVFWYDSVTNNTRTLIVLQGGLPQAICAAGQNRCPMTYNPPPFTPTPSVTPTSTATLTPVVTDTPTATYTPTQSSAPELARQGVTRNADWTPYFETFDGVEMALVPVGCFDMGENGEGGRQCFDEPFWIDRYEVTNAQYKRCVDAGGCTPPDDTTYYDDPEYAEHPVVYIDWYQASSHAVWRGSRLPTEAQWEYAARGPDGLIYPWGDEFDRSRLNIYGDVDGYERTAPVGAYVTGASWVGALDLSGNVWEWMSSIYDDYPYRVDDGREDQERRDSNRTLRGGSWNNPQDNARASYRLNHHNPYYRYLAVGFRLARPFS